MRQVTLPRRTWKADCGRLDDAGCAVAHHQQRVAERARMSRKKAETVSPSSFEPAIRCSSTLRPSNVKPQAARNGSRRCPGGRDRGS